MGGTLVIKAPTYKLVEENSKFSNSYFYALDQESRKSLYYPMFIGYYGLPLYGNVGKY